MKKLKALLLILIVTIMIVPKVFADMTLTYDVIYNENNQRYRRQYINKKGELVKKDSHAAKMSITIDGKKYTAYCIELGVHLEKNVTATAYDLAEFFSNGISDKQKVSNLIQKINLYTRYGYGNNNMTSDKYYLATQLLIWQAIQESGFYDSEFYTGEYGQEFDMVEFGWVTTDNIDGDWVDLTTEMNNIKLAINKHNVTPSLCSDKTKLELEAGTSATYVDANGVLGNYQVECSDNLTCKIDDNKLYVTAADKTGADTIKFTKSLSGMENYAYRSENYQALAIAGGKLNDITCDFGIDTYKNVKTGNAQIYYVISAAILLLGFSSIFYFSKYYKINKAQ